MTDALKLQAGQAVALTTALAALVPVIETERLRLRAPMLTDDPAYEAVFVSQRSVHMGGSFTAQAAFMDFCQAVAGWMLRGAGVWTITTRSGDAPLGWGLTEGAEGFGYATEAAMAILPRAFGYFGSGGVVSYIDAANHRSARIATRLGARRDAVAETALNEADLHIYRHFAVGDAA